MEDPQAILDAHAHIVTKCSWPEDIARWETARAGTRADQPPSAQLCDATVSGVQEAAATPEQAKCRGSGTVRDPEQVLTQVAALRSQIREHLATQQEEGGGDLNLTKAAADIAAFFDDRS